MVQLGSIVEEAVEKELPHPEALSSRPRGLRGWPGPGGPLLHMETEQCSLFRALGEAPVLRVFPVALVSGLLRGARLP